MTCLYKLMAPSAAPEHVMVPTNVFSHRLKSLSLSLSLSFSLSLSLSPRNSLSQAIKLFFQSCLFLLNWFQCYSFKRKKASSYFYSMARLSLDIVGLHGMWEVYIYVCISVLVMSCRISRHKDKATGLRIVICEHASLNLALIHIHFIASSLNIQ